MTNRQKKKCIIVKSIHLSKCIQNYYIQNLKYEFINRKYLLGFSYLRFIVRYSSVILYFLY